MPLCGKYRQLHLYKNTRDGILNILKTVRVDIGNVLDFFKRFFFNLNFGYKDSTALRRRDS